ncbi:membrane protein insertase YidC [soil metagenome]
MDRNSLVRTALIFGVILLLWKVVLPKFGILGNDKSNAQSIPEVTYVNAPTFAPDPVIEPAPVADAAGVMPTFEPAQTCNIKGNRFDATFSTRGAALTNYVLRDPKYAGAGKNGTSDLITSSWDAPSAWSDVERWRPLRETFRTEGANDQVKFDRFPWKVEQRGDTGCAFTYEDDTVKLEKTIKAGERPFELDIETKVTNLADADKSHRLAVEGYAFRQNQEMKGHLGRVSPFATEVSCAKTGDIERKSQDSFKDGWFAVDGVDRYAAISNYYFAQVIVPENGPARCEILSENWATADQKADDDEAGYLFHSRLAYEPKTLKKGESAVYQQTTYMGPKDRDILKTAGGPGKNLGDIVNLGFFSPVAKVLMTALVFIKTNVTNSWGLAIIVLTLFVKLLTFPLQWKSLKSTIAMRRLKPQLDALTKKFEGDAQAKNLAMWELYKKNGVNPFGGCLPQLIQMPVWFAMYTTLQSAVEMYHTHFLWFKDLSAPDQLFGPVGPLPLVLGGFMILQQRIVPAQGMDPMQQKMMTYIMPAVFTVMMLFLPAALGVYMLTNSILNITQQLVMEKIAPRDGGNSGEIGVKQNGKDDSAKMAGLGKGKARV